VFCSGLGFLLIAMRAMRSLPVALLLDLSLCDCLSVNFIGEDMWLE
jgi:hypothetical protein